MRKDAAHRIEQEFFSLLETNPLFKEYVELHTDLTMADALQGWKWVQKLVEKAISRTIRDLTCAPPPPTLGQRKDR